jgi:hypothetical protein
LISEEIVFQFRTRIDHHIRVIGIPLHIVLMIGPGRIEALERDDFGGAMRCLKTLASSSCLM